MDLFPMDAIGPFFAELPQNGANTGEKTFFNGNQPMDST